MIRTFLALALVLGAPASAETGQAPAGKALCEAIWSDLSDRLAEIFPVSGGTVGAMVDDWCVIEQAVIDMPGNYTPDWHARQLRFRGTALPWLIGAAPVPDRLEVAVEGLALVIQTGDAQMDYLLAAQARANPVRADLVLSWDAAQRALSVERLEIGFPGANRLLLSARLAGVDLGSTGAMQMSVTSFAVTEADLLVQSNGLFERYLLMALGPVLLPREGDMEAAAARLKADMAKVVDDLPEAFLAPASKAALTALVAELPNPSGTLTVTMRSVAGIGPARVMGYAMTGVPATLAEAAPLLDGVTLDVGWAHAETP